jgi:hypothetical protein
MPDLDTILGWRGRTVLDRKGDKLGRIGELYLDEDTDLPAYAGVRTGLFGHKESIVPLEGMEERDDDLVVPHDAELVRDAPSLSPDDDALGEADQERLARHYAGARDAGTRDADAGADDDQAGADRDDDRAGMVRSEEEVVTGTTPPRPVERVRVRKVRVTDHVTKTVPVRREEIRLETDPPPEGEVESVEDAP